MGHVGDVVMGMMRAAARLDASGEHVLADRMERLAVNAAGSQQPVSDPQQQIMLGFQQGLNDYDVTRLTGLKARYDQEVQRASASLQAAETQAQQGRGIGARALGSLTGAVTGMEMTDPKVLSARYALQAATSYRDMIDARLRQLQSGDSTPFVPPPMAIPQRPQGVPEYATFNAGNQTWSNTGRTGNPYEWKTWGEEGRLIDDHAKDLAKPENEWYRQYLNAGGGGGLYTGNPHWRASSPQVTTDYTGSGRPANVPANTTWNFETRTWTTPFQDTRGNWTQPYVWDEFGNLIETPQDVANRQRAELDASRWQPMRPWSDLKEHGF